LIVVLRQPTFEFAELVEGFESGRVVSVVGLEGNSEEVSVGGDLLLDHDGPGFAAHPAHLAVHQLNVEVGKLDVVALRVLAATAPVKHARNIIAYLSRAKRNTGWTKKQDLFER